jgi:hypothetical protein
MTEYLKSKELPEDKLFHGYNHLVYVLFGDIEEDFTESLPENGATRRASLKFYMPRKERICEFEIDLMNDEDERQVRQWVAKYGARSAENLAKEFARVGTGEENHVYYWWD